MLSADTKWTALSLGEAERELVSLISKRLQTEPGLAICVPLVEYLSRLAQFLQKEDEGMYNLLQSKVWYSQVVGARGIITLFPDVLRHILSFCSKRTKFIAKFGLTCKMWYPGVWKTVDALCPPTYHAAISLSKRKAIEPRYIREIKLDVLVDSQIDVDTIAQTFGKRFYDPNNVSSLRKLTVVQRINSNPPLLPLTEMQNLPASLRDFEFRLYGDRAFSFPHGSFEQTILGSAWSGNLTRLWLDLRHPHWIMVTPPSLDRVATSCPNLVELGLFFDNRYHSAGDINQAVPKMTKLQRFVIHEDSSALEVDRALRNHLHEGWSKGVASNLASELLNIGKQWVAGIQARFIPAVWKILATRVGSIFELALHYCHSFDLFDHCYKAGLPLSIAGQNSALACLVAGALPAVSRKKLVQRESLGPKKAFDWLKAFLKIHGDEVDFRATTLRLPCEDVRTDAEVDFIFPPKERVAPIEASVNLLQAAVLSGNFEILNLITKQVEEFYWDQFTPIDLLCSFYSGQNIIRGLFSGMCPTVETIHESLKCLFQQPRLAATAKMLINKPGEDGMYPIEIALLREPEIVPLLTPSGGQWWTTDKSVVFDVMACAERIRQILEDHGWSRQPSRNAFSTYTHDTYFGDESCRKFPKYRHLASVYDAVTPQTRRK